MPRRLAHEHQVGVRVAGAEHHLGPALVERAAHAARGLAVQLDELLAALLCAARLHGRKPRARRRRQLGRYPWAVGRYRLRSGPAGVCTRTSTQRETPEWAWSARAAWAPPCRLGPARGRHRRRGPGGPRRGPARLPRHRALRARRRDRRPPPRPWPAPPRWWATRAAPPPLGALRRPRAAALRPAPAPDDLRERRGLDVFAGAGCAVAGSSPEALGFASGLAQALGMTAFEIDDEGRAAYHAAASVASNFLVTLQAAAESIAAGAGLEPVRGTRAAGAAAAPDGREPRRAGPRAGAHGPGGARRRARPSRPSAQAVAEIAPHLLELFDELVHHTRTLAGQEVPA